MDDRIKIRPLTAAKLAPGDASVLAIEGGEFPLEGV